MPASLPRPAAECSWSSRAATTGQAWRAAGGMLAPQIEADGDDPLLELGLAAREHYQALATALQETTGIDMGLWREGIARVASDRAEAGALRSKVAWQQQQGHACDWLDADEVRRRWPWLGPAVGALWAPRRWGARSGAAGARRSWPTPSDSARRS